ncbi:MAG: hypothetical protein QF797_19830 [Alphaproteobacteria bacterium]|jgi:hypothetical protein|nr:hypothetical protein [Alphaproteobacteria bacterium]|tara:strand:+ start:4089 stop:4373 length:285 start_codon:yes stop_codon:yes gene_type:complete
MRRTYIWDPATRKMVEKTPQVRAGSIFNMPDLQPYQNIVDGKVIGGRAAHREFLRKGDGKGSYQEVGNEKPAYMRDRDDRRKAGETHDRKGNPL